MASPEKYRNEQAAAAEHDGLWIFFAKVYYPMSRG
jgi:hypothetical protein